VLQRTPARLTATRLEALLRAKRGQIPQVRVRYQDDVAARPAVTAVRPAPRHMLFTTEVQTAVTTAAGLNVNLRSVLEHAGTLAPEDCCGEEWPERARRRRT
jgi:hypothetical protein